MKINRNLLKSITNKNIYYILWKELRIKELRHTTSSQRYVVRVGPCREPLTSVRDLRTAKNQHFHKDFVVFVYYGDFGY